MTASGIKILTLNSGSSSLKFSIYRIKPEELLLLSGKLERIGLGDGHFEMSGVGIVPIKESPKLPDHSAAIDFLLKRLQKEGTAEDISMIGHRVVMGGPNHSEPQLVTGDLLKELEELCRIDPPHLPAAIHTIKASGKFHEGIPQVACFDTSFHRTLPPVAQAYALPRAFVEKLGIIRYGFHGLSYEFVLSQLRKIDPGRAEGKVVLAHLGNGASMAAVHKGKSCETTMGFSPAGGLVMGSRSGDLDPGVMVYLLNEGGMSAENLNDLIYRKSGLLGVSELSPDMQDLTEAMDRNPKAGEAINLFCYHIQKAFGALVSVMDGVETLVFTGGIGEHSCLVRRRICEKLSFFGIKIDEGKNIRNEEIISTADSRVRVRVIKTNEELMIARHSAELLQRR